MTSTDPADLSASGVVAAAGLVGLPLTEYDTARVTDLLNAWIPAARALSARMQAEENEAIAPITEFTIPDAPTLLSRE